MHASDTALLAFQDVRVPESAVLGQVGKGFYHIMWELQGERLIGAAGSVAGAQHVFDRTLQYAKERTAFGRAIGNFQVIRHKFAEMATKIETARQMVYTTAWRFQNGEYPVREITMAKLYASRIAVEVADECIQIHGGNGYMKEYGIERVVARPAPEPDRRRDRRDHARRDRALLRALSRSMPVRRFTRPPNRAPRQRPAGRARGSDPPVHAPSTRSSAAAVRRFVRRPSCTRTPPSGRTARWFPNDVFAALRRARLPRPEVPGRVRRRRRSRRRRRVRRGARAVRLGRPRRRDRRARRDRAAADLRSSAPRSRSSATSCPASAARRSPRWRSPSPTPAPTSPRSARWPSGRRRLPRQRLEDVHHRRRAGRRARHGRQDRPPRAAIAVSRS